VLSYFSTPPLPDSIPTVLPSPFAYTPHPLAAQAANLLQQRLSTLSSSYGKMFGVLVLRDNHGDIGYLSAFSGMFNGEWLLPGFVPPLFDQNEQDSFLPTAKAELNRMAEKLATLEASRQRVELIDHISSLQQQRDQSLDQLKQQHRKAKAERKSQRLILQKLDDPVLQQAQMRALALASQHQKRALTNAKMAWSEKIDALQFQLDAIETEIKMLRQQRSEQSRLLHQRVFATYQLSNTLAEKKPISHFFKDGTPPAGAGDCAGAKLIHYALKHQLRPLAMAEF